MNEANDFSKLPKGFLEQLSKTKDVIQELEIEEYKERFDTIESVKNRMISDVKNTDLNKHRFIQEIKSNLGEEIKKDPRIIMKIKRPWYYKISKFFNKLFKTV